ncbi:hypothetical protein TNCV_2851971 [Trichonephila clavipes]|nr:hypothetical protein TNCV_2851971 [Trichonephila clavipes]
MHQITCESSPRLERGGPPRCIKLSVNRHLDWNEVPSHQICHWTLQLTVLKLFLGDLCFNLPVQHVILPVQHVTDPRVKTILGDLCFILPVQHVILPVQHVIGPRVKTIFGRPLFHFTSPACHFTCPACHWTRPACHWTPVLKLFLGDLCFIGFILPVQHVILPCKTSRPLSFYQSSMSFYLFSMSLDPVLKLFLGDLCFILPVQHVILLMSLDSSSMSLDPPC